MSRETDIFQLTSQHWQSLHAFTGGGGCPAVTLVIVKVKVQQCVVGAAVEKVLLAAAAAVLVLVVGVEECSAENNIGGTITRVKFSQLTKATQ